MTRKIYPISFVAGLGLLLVVSGVAGGSADATTMAALADQIRAQTEATRAAMALANDVWTPRIAGLGIGLTIGLVAGGASAYLTWGDGA